jgi:hypothetical protein
MAWMTIRRSRPLVPSAYSSSPVRRVVMVHSVAEFHLFVRGLPRLRGGGS